METWLAIVLIVVALAIGFAAGYFVYHKMLEAKKKKDEALIKSAENEAERILSEAKEKAATAKKTALLEAKEESYKLRENAEKEIQKQRSDADRELKERRAEVTKSERRLLQKEENLDRKTDKIERMEESLTARNENAKKKLAEAEALRDEQQAKLQEISGYTLEQAKELLLEQLDNELTHEKAVKILAYQQQLKDECDDKARSMIALAISRLASETVSEMTVSVVPLPNDEMKGRIIGREGRNIRTLEQLTGVDLIIDDTPEAITLSSHDKVRREIARISLERLIQDGRIHPTRIEEMVEKAKREVEQKIKREGEHACLETNVNGLSPELVKLLGRLHFRTSYSQNVLIHSIEVAHLAGIMASELGVDATLARRAGLLHDIGKALTHEIEGSHVAIGVEVCKKYKENPEVVHAVECRTVIAALVQAADAISAARPAARSENYESYIKRLQKLEEICTDYEGVEKSYAIQAGREVRILIKPEVVNDEQMTLLARTIAQRIEQEVDYPGQIKINLIRESRTVDYAK